MTEKEAGNTPVGTRVMYYNDPQDLGIVTNQGDFGFRIKWDYGYEGWIAYSGAQHVTVFDEEPA